MAIKINTAYKEILTSTMLNEKISGVVGGNEKVNGFDVSISTPTSVTVTPGKAYVNGCSIEETSDKRTILLDENTLSNDGIVYIVLEYTHKTKTVEFSCKTQVDSNMVKLATATIKNEAIAELINHESINTLNTVVGASADIEAQKIRDAIPSGFTELGQLDYDFMLNNENKVKIKGKSTAYVNGYRVEIPAGTVIDVDKAPGRKSREDLLFLEAWKDSDFSKSGKLKWRIRHVAGVDFNMYKGDGFAKDLYSGSWNAGNPHILVQGGNANPIKHSYDVGVSWASVGMRKSSSVVNIFTDDGGLLLCGRGKVSKEVLKTADGYAYAIPMFRLYRKPFCGQSIPFEYSKINPKVDYSKITKLLKEEKVERVISEHIQGRSLTNLVCDNSPYINAHYTCTKLLKPGMIKNNTTYTIAFDLDVESRGSLNVERLSVSIENNPAMSNASVPFKSGRYKVEYTTRDANDVGMYPGLDVSDNVRLCLWVPGGSVNNGQRYSVTNFTIVEGTIPSSLEYFDGLKSLGEDNGNLITIKNGILNDDSYDVNDGNQKLNTFSEVTHVLSKNAITPTVTAKVNKGGENIQSLDGLGTKLTTDGTETIEFASIKGRTLYNLATPCKVNGNNKQTFYFIDNSHEQFLKPNKKYTIILYPSSPKIHMVYLIQGVQRTLNLNSKNMALFTTIDNPSSVTGLIHFYTTSDTTVEEVKDTKVVLLEGDYTDVDFNIPYFENIKSVGETEVTEENNYVVNVRSCGTNLLNIEDIKTDASTNTLITPIDNGVVINNYRAWFDVEVGKERKLMFSCDALFEGSNSYSNIELYAASYANTTPYKAWRLLGVVNVKTTKKVNFSVTLRANEDRVILFIPASNNAKYTLTNAQLEAGTTATAYKHHLDYDQNIHLKEPLRGLPSGVCDEIIGNKVIRKVGKYTFTGSEAFGLATTETDYSEGFTTAYVYKLNANIKAGGGFICDRFKYYGYDPNFRIYKNEDSCSDGGGYKRQYFRIANNKLPSPDLPGFKTWLSQHPTTIYYELDTPIEEPLENVYEKESIKTYQLDAPLRCLPNGLGDEIKDGKLIRRCGEMIISDTTTSVDYYSLTGTPNPNKNALSCFCVTLPTDNKIQYGNIVSDTFKYARMAWDTSGAYTFSNHNTHNRAYFVLPKKCLTSDDRQGVIEWLRTNPIKIIYQLAYPTETPLTEANTQAANFSLQRQCAEGEWLRELPNGIKDTIEGNKVIRRVGKAVLNGSEAWSDAGLVLSDTIRFGSTILQTDIKRSSIFLCNEFSSHSDGDQYVQDVEGISCNSASIIYIRIARSKLATANTTGFKAWLSQNPITVLYELAQPTEEALAIGKHMPHPYHDLNTYCGSLYAGEGRNYALNINKILSANSVVLETDFRTIEGKANIDDCMYKKCDDGRTSHYEGSRTKNLFNPLQAVDMYGTLTYDEARNMYTHTSTSVHSACRMEFVIDSKYKFKPNTKYILQAYVTSNDFSGNIRCATSSENYNAAAQVAVSAGSNNVLVRLPLSTTSNYDPVSDSTLRLRIYLPSKPIGCAVALKDIMLIEDDGEVVTKYANYIPTTKYFENTEENDIEDLRHQVSLTGFNYDKILNESFDKLLRGEL